MSEKYELIKAWINKAEHDLGIAKIALDYKPEYIDVICFHFQQAVEKYLKAYLVYLDINFKRTHSLTYLLDLLAEKIPVSDEIYSLVENLEDYTVEIRYPDVIIEPSIEDVKDAYQITIEIRKFVMDKIPISDLDE